MIYINLSDNRRSITESIDAQSAIRNKFSETTHCKQPEGYGLKNELFARNFSQYVMESRHRNISFCF